MQPNRVILNKRLADAIYASGLKQNKLAIAAGLYPDELSHFKHGRRKPTPDQKDRLSLILGVPVADLFDEHESLAYS